MRADRGGYIHAQPPARPEHSPGLCAGLYTGANTHTCAPLHSGHCQRLEPEYAKASKELFERGIDVRLAKADATESSNKELAERFGVKGYPTLKMFRGNNAESVTDYNGPREADGIVGYLAKQAGPATTEVREASQVTELTSREDVVVVGVFPGGKPSATFMDVANAKRDEFRFAHTGDGAPSAALSIASNPTVA